MNNINLILPLNGKGERFYKGGFSLPKPLIKFNSKEMIFHLLDNLDLSKINKIFIPYTHLLDKYNFQKILKNRYKNNFVFLTINQDTRGAAETLQLCSNIMTEEDKKCNIMIIDSDTFYFENVVEKYQLNDNKNCIFYYEDTSNSDMFSFINIQNNKVIEIKEKERISNYANCGIFCCESFNLLKKYIDLMISLNDRQKNEFYTSGIYKFMIYDKVHISPIIVENFKCVGTPQQLENYLKELK